MASTLESLGVKLTLVKRNGKDGASIPGGAMQPRSCLFGRGDDVDVKILLNAVSLHQCHLIMDDNDDIYLEPLADDGLTYLNGVSIKERALVRNGDIVGVDERRFRLVTAAGEISSKEAVAAQQSVAKNLLNRSLKRRSSVSAASVEAALEAIASPRPLKSPRRSNRQSLSTLSDNIQQPVETTREPLVAADSNLKQSDKEDLPPSASKYGRRRSSQPLNLSTRSSRRSSVGAPLDLSMPASKLEMEPKIVLTAVEQAASTSYSAAENDENKTQGAHYQNTEK